MQAFYIKKEKKLSNDYHEINTGNQSNFYENVKDNEIKYFLTKVSNLFFKESLMKQSKTINLKLATKWIEYFFCKTLDIFLKHDKIIVVRANKIAFKQEQNVI